MKEFTIKAEPLLRCPFCGGDAVTAEMYNTKLKKFLPIVKCLDCECRTLMTETFEEAITAWNTRKPMERILERLKTLKQIELDREDACDEDGFGDGEEIFLDGVSQGRHEAFYEAIEIVKEEGGIE